MIDLTPYINEYEKEYGETAIHCPTQEEANTLMDITVEQGHIDLREQWPVYHNRTVFYFYQNKFTSYASIDYAKSMEAIIIPCSDILFPFPPPTPMSEEDFNDMLFG